MRRRFWGITGSGVRCCIEGVEAAFDASWNALSWKEAMEVQLSPEKEAQLKHFATRTGREAEQLVVEAVDRLLEYDARFIEAVEEGRAAARRGELLEHEEVVARIESMFQS